MPRQKVDRDLISGKGIAPVKLKYDKTVATSRALVLKRGQYYHTPVRGSTIPFMQPDGKPNCLVGATLTKLGVKIPKSLYKSSVGKLRRLGIIECNDKTYNFLMVLQDSQDDGLAWGPSLWLSECTILESKLPWTHGKIAA